MDKQRAEKLLKAMDEQGFGGCSNYRECERVQCNVCAGACAKRRTSGCDYARVAFSDKPGAIPTPDTSARMR